MSTSVPAPATVPYAQPQQFDPKTGLPTNGAVGVHPAEPSVPQVPRSVPIIPRPVAQPVAAPPAAALPGKAPVAPAAATTEAPKRGRPVGSKNGTGASGVIAELRAAQQRTDDALAQLAGAVGMLVRGQSPAPQQPVVAQQEITPVSALPVAVASQQQVVAQPVVAPLVSYPAPAPATYNPLPAQPVMAQHQQVVQHQQVQHQQAAQLNSNPSLQQYGQTMHRDYTKHFTEIPDKDRNGNVVIDRATGQPVMKTVNAKCHPVLRAYIERTFAAEFPAIELQVLANGVPTGGKLSCRFVNSKSSGNPQFYCADPVIMLQDSSGNVCEFKAGTGLYFGLQGYNGAPQTDAHGNYVTRADAA